MFLNQVSQVNQPIESWHCIADHRVSKNRCQGARRIASFWPKPGLYSRWERITEKKMLDEKALIPCKINQTVKLSIGDPNVEFNSGCSVIEVSIPPSKRCKVS